MKNKGKLIVHKAWVYPMKHRSGNVTYKVEVGNDSITGKADVRTFETSSAALNFTNDWNAKFIDSDAPGLADLSALNRAELLAALAKLAAVNMSLSEAVDFAINHARPEQGEIKLASAVEKYIDSRRELRLSKSYLNGCTYCLRPFSRAMGDRNVTTITRDDCKRYLFSQPGWNPTTIKSNATVIVCFFNWLVSNGYLKANPASKIELPKGARNTRVKVMSVSDARSLLQWALNNPFYKSCVFNLALVLFAGVRVEESTRLNWGDVDLENGLVTIGDEVAKIDGQRRVNRIPPNAIAWLRAIQGETLPGAMFLHRARMIRKESKATYPKNAARHCFASYHLAVNTPEETAKLLGHPNARLLFSTYNNFAKPDQGKEFFAIIP